MRIKMRIKFVKYASKILYFKQNNALKQLLSSRIQNISMKINQDQYQTQFRVRNCKEV